MKNKKMRTMFKYRYLIASHRISWVEVFLFLFFILFAMMLNVFLFDVRTYKQQENLIDWQGKKIKRKEIITDTRYSIRNVKRKNRTC